MTPLQELDGKVLIQKRILAAYSGLPLDERVKELLELRPLKRETTKRLKNLTDRLDVLEKMPDVAEHLVKTDTFAIELLRELRNDPDNSYRRFVRSYGELKLKILTGYVDLYRNAGLISVDSSDSGYIRVVLTQKGKEFKIDGDSE